MPARISDDRNLPMSKPLFISVIIPVYNGSKFLKRCLDALRQSAYQSYEIILVDDASTDHSAAIGRAGGAKVLQLSKQSGPAAARNYGAQQARGDVLFFVDADVLVQPESLTRIATDFTENPDVTAVFGSYDLEPAEKNFLSQYKNLSHHFVHQQSSEEATTFWAGCGAVRREEFIEVGGFDQKLYCKPCIEDIELGYRLRRKGYHILLDKNLQVKHLKLWKLGSLLRADIMYRAIPWSMLILKSKGMINDLNLQTSDRLSAGAVGLLVPLLLFSILQPRTLYVVAILVALVIALNYKQYAFFLRLKGFAFTLRVLPMHLLYFLYSGTTFTLCWMVHTISRKKPVAKAALLPKSRFPSNVE